MSIFSSGPDTSSNDIFRTQADARFNSFSQPINAVNMNPGAWGVDPNYLTPPYLSPFRPQYQGPNTPNYSYFKPSFFTSLNQVANPLSPGGDNYGGNYNQQHSPYYDKLSTAPVDTTMSFAQNWAIPAAASWAAYKYWGGPSTAIGRAIGGGVMSGLFKGAGIGAVEGGTLSTAQKIASMGIRAGSWTGGVASGLLLPMALTQLGVDAADKAIFDPYIGQRNLSNDLRQNFQGVTFGQEGVGDVVTGGGLSRRKAAQIATEVSKAGAKDMTFTQNETSLLTDYASRAGLMDNANPLQMASRFETILKQVKLVMSVANTSDFRETIEIMAKMQMAGAGSPQLAGLMGRMGAAAGAAGQSVQKLMNTVGAQGQYLFAAQGLTPYVGQEAAFMSSASMNAAYRSGLISPTMMARMGGVEGATQSATAGQLASYQTPYANMQAYNRYFGSGETGNVVSNVAQFGGAMSNNTLQSTGNFELMNRALTSRHIQDRGVAGEEQQIYELAKQLPGGINSSGKVDAGVAYMIMTKIMGLTPDMAQAKISQFHTFNDPNSTDQMLRGSQRASIDALLKYQQQEGLNKGIFTTPYNVVKRGAMAVQGAAAGQVGELLQGVGGVGDTLQNWAMSTFFGVNSKDKSHRAIGFDELEQPGNLQIFDTKKRDEVLNQGLDFGTISSKTYNKQTVKAMDRINELAQTGSGPTAKMARDFITEKDPSKRKDILYKLSEADVGIGKDFEKNDQAEQLVNLASAVGTTAAPQREGGVKDAKSAIQAGLEKILPIQDKEKVGQYSQVMKKVKSDVKNGYAIDEETRAQVSNLVGSKAPLTDKEIKDLYAQYSTDKTLPNLNVGKTLQYMSLMEKVSNKLKQGEDVDEDTRAKIGDLTGSKHRLSKQELKEMSDKYITTAGENRIYHIAGIQANSMEELIKKMKEKGMDALAPQVKSAGDAAATKEQIDLQKGNLEYRQRISELVKDGKIDTASAMSAINALDNKESINKFDKAVDKFVDGVKDSKGEKSGPAVPGVMEKLKELVGGRPVK